MKKHGVKVVALVFVALVIAALQVVRSSPELQGLLAAAWNYKHLTFTSAEELVEMAYRGDVANSGVDPVSAVLRTPDSRFSNLPDYDFEPHYLFSDAVPTTSGEPLRIHYLDEGAPGAGGTIVLMHGMPTWAYTWRHVIPPLVQRGYRVVAPDYVGFGRSDKPAHMRDYSLARQVAWMEDVIRTLDLRDVTLVMQNWSHMAGLRVVAREPERFSRLVFGPGPFMPVGRSHVSRLQGLYAAVISQHLDSATYINFFDKRGMSDAELAAFNAPFPDEPFLAGPRMLSKLPPIGPQFPGVAENLEALERLGQLDIPVLTIWGRQDPLVPVDVYPKQIQDHFPGAKGQPHHVIDSAGHLANEDDPEAFVAALLSWLAAAPR